MPATEPESIRPHTSSNMRSRQAIVAGFLIFVLSGCGQPLFRRPLSDLPPMGAMDQEYEVYSHILREYRTLIVVDDSTSGLLPCAYPRGNFGCIDTAAARQHAVAVADYLERNRAQGAIQLRFAPGIPVVLAHTWHPRDSVQRAHVWRLTLSRVGFNVDSSEAIVTYALSRGRGGRHGFAHGGTLVLRRKPSRAWTRWKELSSWLS